jgi:hypothetical protein
MAALEALGLERKQLYQDKEYGGDVVPSLVLGLALPGYSSSADVGWFPAPYYLWRDIVKWTTTVSAPRLASEAEQRRIAALEEKLEIQRREAERARHVKAEQAAKEEAARRSNPYARAVEAERKTKELEARLAALEEQRARDAADRAQELERRLGELERGGKCPGGAEAPKT